MARCRRRTQWLSAGAFCAVAVTVAAAPPATTAPAPPPPRAVGTAADTKDTAAAPDAALLLYMSEFEDAQGEWIDPAELPAPDAAAVAEDDDDAS